MIAPAANFLTVQVEANNDGRESRSSESVFKQKPWEKAEMTVSQRGDNITINYYPVGKPPVKPCETGETGESVRVRGERPIGFTPLLPITPYPVGRLTAKGPAP